MTSITKQVQAVKAAATAKFPLIDEEIRSHVESACAAYHLNRKEQTLRSGGCFEVGSLPQRHDTVRAAILAALLESNELTGMESVFAQSTTRLSAVIYALETEYGWNIARRDLVVATKDGRTASIVAYRLLPATIERALAMGARAWIDEVKVVRAKLKQHAFERKQDPRQQSLWGDA